MTGPWALVSCPDVGEREASMKAAGTEIPAAEPMAPSPLHSWAGQAVSGGGDPVCAFYSRRMGGG